MELVLPAVKYKEAYLEALKEAENDKKGTMLQKPKDGQSFEDFVLDSYNEIKGLNLQEGYVPATTFWLIDNGQFIGRLQIRHKLSEQLLKHGGHIGYYICPSKRKLGYGKRILELGLQEASKMGIKKVFITCDDDNVGSQKIIEANGGILENKVKGEKEGDALKRRYWIKIK